MQHKVVVSLDFFFAVVYEAGIAQWFQHKNRFWRVSVKNRKRIKSWGIFKKLIYQNSKIVEGSDNVFDATFKFYYCKMSLQNPEVVTKKAQLTPLFDATKSSNFVSKRGPRKPSEKKQLAEHSIIWR